MVPPERGTLAPVEDHPVAPALRAASEDPWRSPAAWEGDAGDSVILTGGEDDIYLTTWSNEPPPPALKLEQSRADQAFVMAARNALPRLIRELRARRKRRT
jgi:hypothetical protein